MCGIIAVAGKDTVKKTIEGLKKLEYRGYDSSGIADNNKIIKAEGKIENLEKKINIKMNNTIAHTRWATHGIPSETNAHPHTSNNITLVHNGIIENYKELKQILIKKGYQFYSETDTEIACKYIDYIYSIEKDIKKAIITACNDFDGSFAFAILLKNDDNIYGIRKDSPLVIGIGKSNNFISSDISSFLVETNKYILLEHNQLAVINDKEVKIYENEKLINYKILTADWNVEVLDKNIYDHFMLKEINEQPTLIKKLFDKYKNYNLNDLSKYKNIHIVGCGSAYHSGLIGKYFFETYLNINTKVEVASEYRYQKQIYDNTLVIVISQSGETADTLAALRIAKENKQDTLGIVNVLGSTIAREADSVIYTEAGSEIAVATTKGYTTQVTILALLTLQNSNIEKKQILKEFDKIDNILSNILVYDYKNIALKMHNESNLFFIGRGIDNYLVLEGSLKLKEISYIHSEAYAAGELKHGTISLIEKGTVLIAVATEKELMPKTISNIKEAKARGAYVIFISTVEVNDDFYDEKLILPDNSIFITSLTVSIVLQLLSYYTALYRNCDIDKPRNLAKSVTVE